MASCFRCHVRERLMFLYDERDYGFDDNPVLVICEACWNAMLEWATEDQ